MSGPVAIDQRFARPYRSASTERQDFLMQDAGRDGEDRMFRHHLAESSTPNRAFETLELIYHVAVRNLRKSHNNAVLGLVMSIIQSMLMLLVMYVMMSLFGMRRIAVRGDFLLYVMSGVFMFMTHIKAIGAVSGADGPTSQMMMHAPMNPITIDEPVGMLGMYLLSWFAGVGIGMIFLSARPWQPEAVGILKTLYQRANVIASGKMVLANNLAPNRRDWFDWNPLFHTIDQSRGYIFLNYTPRFTDYHYAIYFAMVCMMIGLMAEFFTRQYASASWNKRN
jgi:ABC-type polysaccharide/polyol phosphate export permease